MKSFLGDSFSIATGGSGHMKPKLAALKNGGFVAVWQANDGSGLGIKMQMLDGSGKPVGAIRSVNTAITNEQSAPDVAVLIDGSIVVTWDSANSTTWDVRKRMFNPDGSPKDTFDSLAADASDSGT
ncbi:hypothetical protein JKG68_31945 [Microvirga aerilata]|uniref:Uncharacterized protein n=1 Tax=Microvirga aerilata TaxID=670292 RepID=A0A936ZJQ6_9HYPH|nr:hypothetical protein [Microvirga aerilata]MBL0408477.1 hypothetical protein [Microvirga aerilata]